MVAPEIMTKADAWDEADRQNTARLAAIGVKEAIEAAITSIVWAHITNLSSAQQIDQVFEQSTSTTCISSSAPSREEPSARRQHLSDRRWWTS